MKKDRLESFVNENRHEFDPLEPSDKSWEAISNRLDQPPSWGSRRFTWLKVAAMLAIVIITGTLVYQGMVVDPRQASNTPELDPQVRELIEAEAFYAQEVSGKMVEIQNCYKVYPELKSEIESDLNELESMYLALKNDLKENISNREVIEAMIENNRYRLKLVDEVLEQINC